MPSRSSCARSSGCSPWSKARSLPVVIPPAMAWNWASALIPLPATPVKWSHESLVMETGRDSGNDNGVSLVHQIKEFDQVGAGHSDATVRYGMSDLRFMVCTMDVDVPLQAVVTGAAVHPFFKSFQGQNPGQDQILVR